MSDQYRIPTNEEKSQKKELIGKKITIFWDGDDVYYPGVVKSYDEKEDKFSVLYDEDMSGEEYTEDLVQSAWKIWAGTDEEYAQHMEIKREMPGRTAKTEAVEKIARDNQPMQTSSTSSSYTKMTYTAMVIEAVTKLADRHGSSIQTIRKYITNNFALKPQQTASFNSLTKKALAKVVALDILEYDKRLYRISAAEKDRRKEKERALKNAASAASRDAFAMRYGRGSSSRGSYLEGDEAGDPLLLSFHGTAAAYNKSLRIELLSMRSKRDHFLQSRRKILNPFLIEKNYFVRKERLEQERKKEKDAKKVQLKQAAAAQQAAIAASNMYANQYYTSASSNSNPTAHHGDSDSLAAGVSSGIAVPGFVQQLPTGMQAGFQHNPYGSAVAYPAEVGLSIDTPGQDAAFSAPPMRAAQTGGHFPGLAMAAGTPIYGGNYALPPQVSTTSGAMPPNSVDAVQYPASSHPSAMYATQSASAVYPPRPMQQSISVPESTQPQQQGAYPPRPPQQIAPPVSVPTAVVKTEENETPSTSMTQASTVAEIEEDVPDIDDKQLAYSTMEGVRMVPQPDILKAELHEHQIQGISWMMHMFQHGMPMILGDQMGLGKTIQSIGFMASLQTHLKKKGPHLVVVPLSVLSNWLSEIERFCPSFRAVRFHGPKNERIRIKEEELNDLSEFDVVVTTYEILVSEINFIRRKYVWTSIIIDEGHRLKNEKSQFSEKLRLITCLSKVILSGTPLQNNLKELWAMLFYLAPDIFQSSKPFEEGFDLAKGHIDSVVLRKARRLLSVFMLRRLKEHVAIKLPSRRELTLLVPLTKQQHELYKQYLCSLDNSTLEVVMREDTNTGSAAQSSANLALTASNNDTVLTNITVTSTNNNNSNSNSSSSNALVPTSNNTTTTTAGSAADSDWRKLMNLLLQLRKICNHTYLLPDVAPEPYEITDDIVGGSGKLMMLDRMLPKLRQNGHRVLIFSQFTSMLDILEDYCELREYPFVRLDGETNRVKRRLDCRRFNAPRSPLFIFLISTRAGGLGLNLASADTVILYDSDWNPQVDLQAMERAHRIGQTKPVRVYRLVCRGSVEERMVSRAEKKLFLNAMVAEADPDEELHESGSSEEQSEDARRQAEISEALGIGGTAISKGELASLIRFGANAVVEGSSNMGNEQNEQGIAGNQISEEELDALLEMQGRDIPRAPKVTSEMKNDNNNNDTSNSNSHTNGNLSNSTSNHELDDLAKAQQALRDRMNMLKEVDLRQLGSTIYDKKKRKATSKTEGGNSTAEADNAWNVPGILDSKRVRKERVVMMNGRGTGYGGSVPVLAETIEKETPVETGDELKFRSRGRMWSHHTFCCMCGKNAEVPSPQPATISETIEENKKNKSGKMSRTPSTVNLPVVAEVPVNAPVKCAHCPFIFHLECCNGPPPPAPVDTAPGKGYRKKAPPVLTRPSGMFICPHHRCITCNRSTASAGGLLFRCTGCLTAYCEDCLPQDEIESIGRCRPLEKLGYDSKQSYYIRCPYCCHLDGFKPLGILNDNEEANAQETAKIQSETTAVNSTATAGETTLPRESSKTSLKTSRSALSLSSDKDVSEADVGEDEIPDPSEMQEEEMETAEEPIVPLKTQLMRLQWTEIMPTPVPSPVKKPSKSKGKKGKKTSKAKSNQKATTTSSTSGKRKLEVSDEEDSDSEEEEEEEEDQLTEAAAIWREWSQKKSSSSSSSTTTPTDTDNIPAIVAMQELVTHPLWTGLQKIRIIMKLEQQNTTGLTLSELCDSDLLLFSNVLNKIEAGRYRSVGHLVNDVRYIIDEMITKKIRMKLKHESEKRKLSELHSLFHSFLNDEFMKNVVL